MSDQGIVSLMGIDLPAPVVVIICDYLRQLDSGCDSSINQLRRCIYHLPTILYSDQKGPCQLISGPEVLILIPPTDLLDYQDLDCCCLSCLANYLKKVNKQRAIGNYQLFLNKIPPEVKCKPFILFKESSSDQVNYCWCSTDEDQQGYMYKIIMNFVFEQAICRQIRVQICREYSLGRQLSMTTFNSKSCLIL